MARVLIVEDEQGLREVWALALRDFGHAVETAVDGMDGIKRIGAQSFDLILMDLNMPRLDGLEFLKRIRATEPDLPIVAVTATSDSKLAKSVVKAGASAILYKPIRLEELANTIKRFTGEHP